MKHYKYIIFFIPAFFLLFHSTTAKAGETMSWYSINSNISANYVSQASIPFTEEYWNYDDDPPIGNGRGYEGFFHIDWNFNNTVEFLGQNGKFVYGVLFIEYDITIPNPNSTYYQLYTGTVSAEPYISETLRVFPTIKTNTNNHYIYRVCYMFDGYQIQSSTSWGNFISGPNINIKMRAVYNGTPASMPNNGVTPTGTISVLDNTIRFEDTPLNHGLVYLFAQGLDSSIKVDMMLQYLYDIKMNDLQYYNTIVSDLSDLLIAQNNANNTLISILNELDLDFNQVQTVLDLFPSYRTQVLQYWQELLQMNSQQATEASAIESEYQNKEQVSESLSNSMNSVNMPTLSAGDMDILGSIDTTSKTNFFGLIALITHTELVTKIMLIIVTGALIGYILYGKKG